MQLLRVYLSIALCLLAVAQGLAADEEPPYAAHRPVFMLFGDSLTEFGYGYHWKYPTDKKGWVAHLSIAYSRRADVVNRGMAGYNSRWGLQVLPHALADFGCLSGSSSLKLQQQQFTGRLARCNVQLLVIWFSNDAVNTDSQDGRLHVPLDEYKQNLAAMVQAGREAGVQHVVIVTPPPVDEAKWAQERNLATSDRLNAQVEQYAAGAREVARQLGVPLLDIYATFVQQGPQSLRELMNDGVHFAPKGDQLVYQGLKEVLDSKPELADIRSSELPYHYPRFNQVDATNPSKTFKELFDRS